MMNGFSAHRLFAGRYSSALTLLLAWVLACSGHALAENAAYDDAATDQAAWEQLATLQFSPSTPIAFRETRQTRLLRNPKAQSGRLWVEDTGDFVMHVDSPRAEERRLSSNRLSLKRNGRVRSTRLDPQRGAHQLLLAVVDIVQGNTQRLQQNFDVQKSALDGTAADLADTDNADPERSPNDGADWQWTLTPKDAVMREELTRLSVSGSADTLTSLRAERGRSWQEIHILADTPLP